MRMLSTDHAKLAVKILALLLVAAISFFYATSWFSDTGFVKESIESIEESNQTVMAFSAATLSASLAITALPDDFATPIAEHLTDMNTYFIAILVVLLLEKILIIYGTKLSFALLIPWSCIAGAIAIATKKNYGYFFTFHTETFGVPLTGLPGSQQITS